MSDPVTDREGNTFERAAIEAWLRAHGTSPLTRNAADVSELVPNRALRDAIQQHHLGTTQAEGSSRVATVVELSAPRPTAPELEEDDAPLSLSCVVDAVKSEVLVTITPPTGPRGAHRLPVDVCCVIDISGSMGDSATVQNEQGKTETHGLCLLDIVKHATRTVAGMLEPSDRLALVTFTDNANVALDLRAMDAGGKAALDKVCEVIQPQSMTNLWDGLLTGMDVLRKRTGDLADRNAVVLLLTDGQPNVEPPRGHVPSLERYLDQFNGTCPFTVSTFGFGYNLDSGLLGELSSKTGGMYVFIPDSGLVGTVFVNIIANVLCTAVTGLQVTVDSGRPLVVSDATLTTTTSGAHGALGTVQYGQARHVTFRLGDADTKAAAEPPLVRIQYRSQGRTYRQTVSARLADTAADREAVNIHVARRQFALCVQRVLATKALAGPVKQASDELQALPNASHPMIQALLKDLQGEVVLALRKDDDFQRWGRHYLPSLVRATWMEQCNNFKDFSVQLYGGDLFKRLQSAGEAVFCKLPPPKPSRPQSAAATGGKKGSAAAVAAPSMKAYYNCGGGCVLPHCTVALQNGRVVPAASLRKGDVLSSGATVSLVVKIALSSDAETPMIQFPDGGLTITQYHPVRVEGKWAFPIDVRGVTHVTTSERFVYTFVLDGGHSLTINDVEVVSLAHGLTGDAVVEHEYLGTQRVLDDLATLDGFDEGLVEVGGFVRDSLTRRIRGLRRRAPVVPLNEHCDALPSA